MGYSVRMTTPTEKFIATFKDADWDSNSNNKYSNIIDAVTAANSNMTEYEKLSLILDIEKLELLRKMEQRMSSIEEKVSDMESQT